jgi:MscS family membrane protein
LIIYCFTVETDWETWLAHKERLAIAIKEIVENTGASFAYPSVSIYQEIQVPEMVAVPTADIAADKEEI